MARRPRRLAAGLFYHVHNRGALGRRLFAADADWRLFLGAMRDARAKHPIEIMGWCLMPNHWHLLLRPLDERALPAFVRWLTLAHNRRWRAMREKTDFGTLYQGRYRSHPIDGDTHFFTVLRYIERNPVRAGLVARAADWPWSSLRTRLSNRPGLLDPLPMALPADWLARLDAAETPAEIAACEARQAPHPTAVCDKTVNAR